MITKQGQIKYGSMNMKPVNSAAYDLFQNGCIALSEIECNGIKIDTDYLQKAIESTNSKIKSLTEDLKQSKIAKAWRKHYGQNANFGSREQLGKVLFDVVKYKYPGERTKTNRYKADEAMLESLDIPFVKKYLRIEKLKKAKGTYLKGIESEMVNGFIYPFFHLNIARTYRGSCSDPNFQNIPIRDPEIAELIRQCFMPRGKDRQIVESDFKGIEVGTAACYHKDPAMLKYIKTNPGKMHFDMAMQCYMLNEKQMTSEARFAAKNNFVFPQFYGDWYINCARNLWQIIDKMKLVTAKGTPLKKHLKKKGIIKLGDCIPGQEPEAHTFEKHLKEVEYDFWHNRFPVYKKWKERWYDAYTDKGYFDTLTGFRCSGYMKRNEVINYPVQGSAFHCLLWSLIRINKLLKKYKMKSLIIGQIHDSIVADVLAKELKNYLEIINQVISVDLLKHWSWIIVPMNAEIEIAPVGKSWYEKEKVA